MVYIKKLIKKQKSVYTEKKNFIKVSRLIKKIKKIHLFLNESGSGQSHDIDYFEMKVIDYFKNLIEKSDEDEK